MTTPSNIHVQPAPAHVTETVEVVAAPKFVRTRTLAKKSFARIGVPVLVGAVSALVVVRQLKADPEDSDTVVTDPTE